MNKQYVAICEKVALTIEEAAEYSNIGQNRFLLSAGHGIQVNALLLLPGIFRRRTAKFFLLETVRGYDIIRMDRKITFEQL